MTAAVASSTDIVRLHITPFNESILQKNIPAAARDSATNISFHALQTFPEKTYGYLEVSRADADSIKKKLNGLTLKGSKIRIEEARPMKRRSDAGTEEVDTVRKQKKVKVAKSAKKPGDIVVAGYELPADRSVKRGWTASKKPVDDAAKAGNTKQERVLFKTVLPPNKIGKRSDIDAKKDKKAVKEKKARKNEVIVQEGQRSRRTFAVSSSSTAARKPAVEYKDGFGWIDEDGEVVEAETKQLRRQREQRDEAAEEPPDSAIDVAPVIARISPAASKASDEDDVASVGSASDSSSETSQFEESDNSDSEAEAPSSEADDGVPQAPTATTTVHPLEALYKRKKPEHDTPGKTLAPLNTSFSFFGAQESGTTDDQTIELAPQTPHTKQDMEWRALRSAAPTPDTAAIDGRFSFPFGPSDDEPEESTPVQAAPVKVDQPQEESAFRKFFFEKRGDNDRAYKKRRREAKKVQRQRENRRLSRRVV